MDINWPELIIGAVIGLGLSLPVSIHERRERKREVGVNWTRDLRSLDSLLLSRNLTYASLYTATSEFPMDHYRRVLGPDDFLALEELQNALGEIAHPTISTKAANHFEAVERVNKLRVEVRDIGARRSGQEYTDLVNHEKWTERRRHPLRWIKNEVVGFFIRRRLKRRKPE